VLTEKPEYQTYSLFKIVIKGHKYKASTKYEINDNHDRLCGLVIRVLGYRSGGPGSIPGTTKKKTKKYVVGLEGGPLSLVITTDELLDRKVAAPV
jgi:hypothetical protein